jgi:tetratricopeptide (TPR) repeat protein
MTLFFTIFLAWGFTQAQTNKIDSLQNLLSTANHDTTKINTLNDLSWELINHGDYDLAMQYANDALTLCDKLLQSDNKQSSIINSKKATAYNNIGLIHKNKGDFDKALEFYFKSLKIFEELGHKSDIAASYNNIGVIHKKKGNYDKALEFYFKDLKITEELGDINSLAISYINIGNIYYFKSDYDKALEFYFNSLKIREELGDKKGMADSYNNIGVVCENKGEIDKALEFYFNSLKIREEIGDKNGMADSHINIGHVHNYQGSYDKSIVFFFKGLKIFEELGDKNGIATSYGNIGMLYASQKKYSEARIYIYKGLDLSKAIGSKDDVKESYKYLSQLDSTLGNWKAAYEYHKLYSVYKDSIFNEESSKQIADMQTKYETDKKEKENQILRQENELRIFTEKAEKEKIERRDNMQYSIILIVVIVLLSSILLLGKISVSPQVAEGLIFFVFLIFFEYILVLSDPYIDSVTGGAPGWKLLINSGIAALIFPLHSFFERLLKKRLTLKNGSNQ